MRGVWDGGGSIGAITNACGGADNAGGALDRFRPAGVKRIGSWPGWADPAVAVDQLGELGGDLEGEGAVEADVLVVGGRDVGQHLVVDVATTGKQFAYG